MPDKVQAAYATEEQEELTTKQKILLFMDETKDLTILILGCAAIGIGITASRAKSTPEPGPQQKYFTPTVPTATAPEPATPRPKPTPNVMEARRQAAEKSRKIQEAHQQRLLLGEALVQKNKIRAEENTAWCQLQEAYKK